MSFVVVSFLSDQFDQLHEEFSKCVSDRGGFSGNITDFRQRHQSISRSVQEADRFLMISNAAYFCCQIISIVRRLPSSSPRACDVIARSSASSWSSTAPSSTETTLPQRTQVMLFCTSDGWVSACWA